jgi:hypothetical protein
MFDVDMMVDAALYMPADMQHLADVHIKLRNGAIICTHKHVLAACVGALPGDAPGMLEASPAAPVVLTAPFDDFEKEDVIDFLRLMYQLARNELPPTAYVVSYGAARLAHALDAQGIVQLALDEMCRREIDFDFYYGFGDDDDDTSFPNMCNFAVMCNAPELLAKCYSVVARHFLDTNGYHRCREYAHGPFVENRHEVEREEHDHRIEASRPLHETHLEPFKYVELFGDLPHQILVGAMATCASEYLQEWMRTGGVRHDLCSPSRISMGVIGAKAMHEFDDSSYDYYRVMCVDTNARHGETKMVMHLDDDLEIRFYVNFDTHDKTTSTLKLSVLTYFVDGNGHRVVNATDDEFIKTVTIVLCNRTMSKNMKIEFTTDFGDDTVILPGTFKLSHDEIWRRNSGWLTDNKFTFFFGVKEEED